MQGSNSLCSCETKLAHFALGIKAHNIKSDERYRCLDRFNSSGPLGLSGSGTHPSWLCALPEQWSTSRVHFLSSPQQLARGSAGNDVLKRSGLIIPEQPEVPESVHTKKNAGCKSATDTPQDPPSPLPKHFSLSETVLPGPHDTARSSRSFPLQGRVNTGMRLS